MRKKSNEEFQIEMEKLVGDEFLALDQYVGSKTKIRFLHIKCNRVTETTPSKFICGARCKYCRPLKYTTQEMKQAIFDLVGAEYELLVEYKGYFEKHKVRHSVCNYEYLVTPSNFIRGRRCPKCSKRIRNKSTEYFKGEVYQLVGNEYTVVGKYESSEKKIKIRHNSCEYEYDVRPTKFLNGRRCPNCYGKTKKSTESFILEIQSIFGDEYSVLGDYVDSKTKIKVRHNLCNYIYHIAPSSMLQGVKCSKCAGNAKKSVHEIFKEVKLSLGEDYVILSDECKNVRSPITIFHRTCGYTFESIASSLIRGSKCTRCKESKGESKIRAFLERNSVNFRSQYSFEDCKNINPLKFDFALLDINDEIYHIIEYDGLQHFQPIEYFGGQVVYEYIQGNDRIKDKYCKQKGYHLTRISYQEVENIEKILYKIINCAGKQDDRTINSMYQEMDEIEDQLNDKG